MVRKFLFIFFLLFSFCSFGQNLKVLSTKGAMPEHSNIVYWEYNDNISSFIEYKIYRKNTITSQPILLTSITDVSQTSFEDTDIAALDASRLYIVEAHESGGIVYTDSLSTIYLSTQGLRNKYVALSWTSMYPIKGGDSVYLYKFYTSDNTSHCIFLESASSYTDTVNISCDTIYYSVLLGNACIPTSSPYCTESNTAKVDVPGEQPDVPVFDSVSVDWNLQKIVLGWQPSIAKDVVAYLILKSESLNGVYQPMDTVWGRNNTSYTWRNGNINQVHYFDIASISKCQTSLRTETSQTNMVLSASSEKCSNTINLSWNGYSNLISGIEKYVLHAKIDGGNYTPVADIASNKTIASYTVPAGTLKACFIIQAVGKDGKHTASSKVACIDFANPEIAQHIYLRSASVTPSNTVTINLYVDASYLASGYELYRYADGEKPAKVAQIPYTGNDYVSYTDNRIYPNEKPYNYYVSVSDACNLTSKSSNLAKTMCLRLTNENKAINYLSWNRYVGWQRIDNYEIYRQEGEAGTPKLLAQLFAHDTMYVDRDNIANATEKLIYYVVANEGSGNAFGFTDQAISSVANYIQQGELFIPSAFMPKSIMNSVFKPILFFIDEKSYHLRIFDRWGLLIFETTDPNQGWDGQYKGSYAPVGAYVYHIECKLSSGEKFSKNGTVNLLE